MTAELTLAEMLIESELKQLGKVRSFHPTKEAKEKRKQEVLAEIKEKTGLDFIVQ